MSGDYPVLAPIYDRIGMADFASVMTSRLLNFAQQNGWMGRRILDLGCGTGVSTVWFAQHGYTVTGVDVSPDMLVQAEARLESENIAASLIEADIRAMENVDAVDMVMALDVMNELDNLRDLESAFQGVQQLLPAGRLFVFDLHTLEGLAGVGPSSDHVLLDEEDLVVFEREVYNFERQVHTTSFDVFERDAGASWQRKRAQLARRAYPVQAVATLLRRQDFEIVAVVDTRLQLFDPDTSSASRVGFVAKKQ